MVGFCKHDNVKIAKNFAGNKLEGRPNHILGRVFLTFGIILQCKKINASRI
jgi:hypothetical protein